MLEKGFINFAYEKAKNIIEEYRNKELEGLKEEELVIQATMIKVVIENASELISKITDITIADPNIGKIEIDKDTFIKTALKQNRLFETFKSLFQQITDSTTSITNKLVLDNWYSKVGLQQGIEKYFNTPDDLFNTNAFYWRYEIRQKKLFDNLETPYQIMMRYFDFLEMYDRPISCGELVVNDFKKYNLNNDEIKFILDNLIGMLFHSENPDLLNVYIELIDIRHDLFPYNEEKGFYDNIWSIEQLREEANQFPTILERIRYFRLKQLEYNREAEELNFDIGISEEIEIEITYLKDVLKQSKSVNLAELSDNTNITNITDELYLSILDYILILCKNLEKYSGLTSGFDEEICRDYLLPFLNSISNKYSATGETFNKSGKTDILIQDFEGRNIFIGECKLWKGSEYMNQAIDQLLERYVNWRDEKTAIIIFNKDNRGFTSIIDKGVECMKAHRNFKTFIGCRKDTSYSFIFKHPTDELKEIKIELMIFNFFNYDNG